MNRRDFLHYTGAASFISTELIFSDNLLAGVQMPTFNTFDELLLNLLTLNDQKVPVYIGLQENNADSKNYGGVHDSYQIYTPGATAGLIKTLTCSVTQKESRYYLDESLFDSIELAIQYLLSEQHSDGTIDLLSTNFHSTPDTGFVVEPICASYNLLERTEFAKKAELLGLLKEFLTKAGEAFIVGGIHTPNHRWVVSMAMARLNQLFPDKRYEKRIDEWLQEGIDIDADGQFEERSTYIYTPLTDRCFVTMAKLLNRPELLEPVRKNLQMTLYYIHPNGEIATEASGRQDQFKVGFMEHYYVPLRYMALHDNNGQFAKIVRQIEQAVPEKLLSYLVYLLEDSGYRESLPQSSNLSDNYIKEFPHSNLVRIRRGNIDATILGKNPTFFTLSKGDAVLASVRLASAFFGRGQFTSEKVERVGDTFILNWKYTWGYFQPLPKNKKANYEVPFDQDRKRRKKSEVQELKAKITISEQNGAFELAFELEGTDNVPLAIELACRNGGKLEGVEKLSQVKNSYVLDGHPAYYKFGNDSIRIEAEKSEHQWTAIRGGLPKPDAHCIYLTGFTPFKKKIRIS
jgi:hypothetical protein